ncbi:disulfide bond formation protein B [Acuticoccus sp.]|uniref:disulfide bond formation protein B n=1 Tax=Acuticoccus sp. TaxID=1904378 RepID=UPI003B52F050
MASPASPATRAPRRGWVAMLSPRPPAALALVIMTAAIGAAWAFEVVGGFAPCPLCLEQRLGYYGAIPLTFLALGLAPHAAVLARLALLAAAGLIAWSAWLGVTHAGAEWGYWPGPDTCAAAAQTTVRDASTLLAAIGEASVESCTEVQGRVLGLSFAGWNVLTAASSAVLLAAAALAPRRPREAEG